jgi:hypothetical protein
MEDDATGFPVRGSIQESGAAFSKESRMKFASAAKIRRKSAEAVGAALYPRSTQTYPVAPSRCTPRRYQAGWKFDGA